MEIRYGDSKENFDSNLKTIKALYKKSTDNSKSSYSSDKNDISELIYTALKNKYAGQESLIPVIEQYYHDLNGLIKELDIPDPLIEKWDYIEFQDYEANKDVYKDYKTKHGKDFYFIPFLYLYIIRKEEKNKSDNMILKMSYVYLHNILDEFLLDTIELVAYLCLKSLGSDKKLSYSDIFSCNDIHEIYDKIVKKELDVYGYSSFQDKVSFLEDRGIKIKLDSVNKDDLVLFGEIRNSMTHSKGIVNEKIVSKLKDTIYKKTYKIGDTFLLSESDLEHWFNKVENYANELFKVVVEKYQNKLV